MPWDFLFVKAVRSLQRLLLRCNGCNFAWKAARVLVLLESMKGLKASAWRGCESAYRVRIILRCQSVQNEGILLNFFCIFWSWIRIRIQILSGTRSGSGFEAGSEAFSVDPDPTKSSGSSSTWISTPHFYSLGRLGFESHDEKGWIFYFERLLKLKQYLLPMHKLL
jgi:hypothetical protein